MFRFYNVFIINISFLIYSQKNKTGCYAYATATTRRDLTGLYRWYQHLYTHIYVYINLLHTSHTLNPRMSTCSEVEPKTGVLRVRVRPARHTKHVLLPRLCPICVVFWSARPSRVCITMKSCTELYCLYSVSRQRPILNFDGILHKHATIEIFYSSSR